jgi:glycosyltransferase involved in cell wall biosynthesis
MNLVSFIVPAHNEEQLLRSTLEAIEVAASQLDATAELIVAADASTDRTAEIAGAHGARVISVNHRQIAATRNAGAAEANGEFLIFVDADTRVTVDAVRGAMAAMKRGAVGGGCGFEFDGRVPLYARLMMPISLVVYRMLGLASGCFLFCTREAFRTVGGFNEELYAAEEAAMSRALAKVGKFVVLKDKVITSGRKLRTFTGFEVLGTLLRVAVTGPKSLRRREGLDIWYGERRNDPGEGG